MINPPSAQPSTSIPRSKITDAPTSSASSSDVQSALVSAPCRMTAPDLSGVAPAELTLAMAADFLRPLTEKKTRVVLGMSGGVDSSVSALILKEAGFEVIGMFMKNWDEKTQDGECTSAADYEDVRRVCDELGIAYYGIEFVQEYWDHVFTRFLEEYRAGFTPNPDILCNREIKFNLFYEHAKRLGADFLATGHYCRKGLARTRAAAGAAVAGAVRNAVMVNATENAVAKNDWENEGGHVVPELADAKLEKNAAARTFGKVAGNEVAGAVENAVAITAAETAAAKNAWENEGGRVLAEDAAARLEKNAAARIFERTVVKFSANTFENFAVSAAARSTEMAAAESSENVLKKGELIEEGARASDGTISACARVNDGAGDGGVRAMSEVALLKGVDQTEFQGKDQSYFVYTLQEEVLRDVLFPVGHLTKAQVRELARRHAVPTAAKKDSTGICFIGERKFTEFLGGYVAAKPGAFKLLDGTRVGTHRGVAFYTLGQRRGLGLGGEGARWYVVAKDPVKNEVFVERGEDSPALYARELWARELSFVAGDRVLLRIPVASPAAAAAVTHATREFVPGLRLWAKIRYRQEDVACTVTRLQNPAGVWRLHVRFDQPQRAITPGQSIVFYAALPSAPQAATLAKHDLCLGGAVIDEVGPTGAPSNSPHLQTQIHS